MNCEFCKSATVREIKFGLLMDSCATCSAFSYRGPQSSTPATLYSQGYFEGGEYINYLRHEKAHRMSFVRKMKVVSKFRSTPFKALEVGCAFGLCADVLFTLGADSYVGTDASAYGIEYARRNFRGSFVCSDLPPVEAATTSTLLVGWDVIEHLGSPATYFEPLLNSLPTGAIFAASTIDSGSLVARVRGEKWRQLHPPTHLHYPSRKSLRCLVERCGFTVKYHKSFGQFRAAESYLKEIRFPVAFLPETFRTYPIPLNLGDTQLLVAEKSGVSSV